MAEFWTVRAGKSGERTAWCFANSLVGGGWTEIPDLTGVKTKEEIAKLASELYQGSKHVVANYTGQLWRLRFGIKVGDYVVLPVRSTSQVAIGKVVKGYHYLKDEEDYSRRHVLGVEWLRTDIPRSAFKQDLLYQMGSALTIFQLANDDAPYRLEQILSGKSDPGSREGHNQTESGESFSDSVSLDIEYIAESSIAKIIEEDFKGHDLSELITALLTAEGYVCRNSPAGPDGGVDILAGKGPLGMDSPRLVVQVKSQSSAVSDGVLQQLNGAVIRFKADQALLVALKGVTPQASRYLATEYFTMRLWEMSDVLSAVYEHYGTLPEEIKAKIPLKQIWIPVSDAK